MKITIQGDWYDERGELDLMLNASNLSALINEWHMYLRNIWKHGEDDKVDVDKLYQAWCDMKIDNNVE